MPIIFLGAELVIERIHRASVISYRNIIRKMDEILAEYPGIGDEEAAYLLADKLGVEIDLEAELQLRKVQLINRKTET